MKILDLIMPFGLIILSTMPALAKDMTFDIIYNNHSNVVVADGEITSETPATFQAFLDTEPFDGFTFYIDLNSPGGSLFGGMDLGEMIRQQGLIARVAAYEVRSNGEEYWSPKWKSGICMSACALAFLGGEDRELDEQSVLGFHQFSSAGTASGRVERVDETERTTQVISSFVHTYIESMGIAPALFSKVSLTPPEEMYIPDAVELVALNIIPAKAFSNFILEPYGDGVVAYSDFYNNAQGRNVVSQVTAYCRGGTPFLLLSQPEHYRPIDDEWADNAYEYLSGFSLWTPPGSPRVDYGPQHLIFKTGGAPVAELQIDAQGVELLNGNTKISVQMPGALGRSMFLEIEPTDLDRRVLQTAFKLCIGGDEDSATAGPELDSEQDFKSSLVSSYNRYLSDWSRDNSNALSAMNLAYDYQIDFYGNTVSKEALLSEKREFAERWPERIYSPQSDSLEINCGEATCVVSAMIDWYAHSPFREKTARGESWYELGFNIKTGLIVFENGVNRKR